MARIDCPECQKKISDKAAACPGCGFPIAAGRKESAGKAAILDPLADLLEMAENTLRGLRESLESKERRKKKEGEEGVNDPPEGGDYQK